MWRVERRSTRRSRSLLFVISNCAVGALGDLGCWCFMEAFDQLAGAVVWEIGDSGGQPLLETHEGLVAAVGHHAVIGEQDTQVVDGSGVGKLVEGVVDQWQFALTDCFEEDSGFGSTHVGVDAFGPIAAGEQANEAVESEVVAGFEDFFEVVV